MSQIIYTLLAVAVFVILFLYIKMKNATSDTAITKSETDQRVASQKATIVTELHTRNEESKEKVENAQEAIDRRKSTLDKFN
jgi:hypothetical protein